MAKLISDDTLEDKENSELVNNEKTKALSKDFQSTEEIINKNLEIESRITSTELINFYFNTLESTNQLLEKNRLTEKNFEKVQKTIEAFSEEVKKLTDVIEKQKSQNEDRKTIDAYKDSWDNINIFIKTMLNKLNAVTISTNNNVGIKNGKKEQKNDTSLFTIIAVISSVLLAVAVVIKNIFF